MNKLKRILALVFILFTAVGCDRATKTMAQTHLSDAPPVTLANGVVRLQYAENPGAFMSFGAALPPAVQHWIFTVLVAVILSGLLIYALRTYHSLHPMALVAVALFLGGGIGNLIDRLINDGRVIDFMNIGIGGLRTGIFNVADMAVTAGVLLIAMYMYRTRDRDVAPSAEAG
jgi:signal peptidase II